MVTIPKQWADAINSGLLNLKTVTGGDSVAVVSPGISTPQIAPTGSPLGGQIAVPQGAPVPSFIPIIIDTSAFAESVTDIECIIGDASTVHAATCAACTTSSNTTEPIIKSATCNSYSVFLNKLCSQPFTFSALSVEVSRTGGTAPLALPDQIDFSRRNLLGEGVQGPIFVSIAEDYTIQERGTVRFAAVSLTNEQARFDADTQWKLTGLVGNRKYLLKLFTGTQKAN